jgi:hypothetical protein
MSTRKLTLPYFPKAPTEYSQQYFDEVVRQFSLYLQQMQNPGDARHTKLALTQLETSSEGLADNDVFNDGGHLALAGQQLFAPLSNSLVSVKHTTANNVGGGSASSGNAVNPRSLTEEVNTIEDCTVSGTDITLPAGSYFTQGFCSVYQTRRSRAFLYNLTDTTPEVLGNLIYARSGSYGDGPTTNFSGYFTISDTKVFQLGTFVESSYSTYGLGLNASTAGSTYDTVHAACQIWRVG